MKISKHGYMLSNEDLAACGATYDKGLTVRLYDSKCNIVELSNEEVVRIISLADSDTLRTIVDERTKNKMLDELHNGILDDAHYIIEKMAKCEDESKLQRVLVVLERLTADI